MYSKVLSQKWAGGLNGQRALAALSENWYIYGSLQRSLVLVPEDMRSSSGLHGHQTYIWNTYVQAGKTSITHKENLVTKPTKREIMNTVS